MKKNTIRTPQLTSDSGSQGPGGSAGSRSWRAGVNRASSDNGNGVGAPVATNGRAALQLAPGSLSPFSSAVRRDRALRSTRARTNPRVSVVIPAHNEARNLPHVLAKLPERVSEVVLVDGNSTDATMEVARLLRPDVRIVRQTRRGKGNALACGFAACSGDIIVMLDADGSADPAEIPHFVRALTQGADFAKGTRFVKSAGSSDITSLRRIGNRSLLRLVNALFGTRYTDLCYGYNAFWRHCLPAMRVDCDGFEVETAIHIRVARARLWVVEVPSFERNRIYGKTHLRTFRDGWRVLRTIIREWARGRAKPAPRATISVRRGSQARR
jgi:hypothetical protein